MTPQPFSSGFEEQAFFFEGVRLKFDYDAITEELMKEAPELQEMVFSNMEKYKNIFYEDSRHIAGRETEYER